MDLHHVHLFCSDIEATVQWWTEMMGAEVAFDGEMGGSRNVFMRIGEGRLHLYDQHPRGDEKNAVHHIGIRCTNLVQIYETLRGKGVAFRSGVREFGSWRYIMCPAPDGILLELFEIDLDQIEEPLARYFSDAAM